MWKRMASRISASTVGPVGDVAGEVGNVGRKVLAGLFNHDGIAHHFSSFGPACFQYAIEDSWRHIVARLPGDGDPAGFFAGCRVQGNRVS